MKGFLLLAWVTLPFDAGRALDRLIRKIEVEGNLRVPAECVLHEMRSQPCTSLDPGVIAGDIRRLHDTHLFQEVEIRTLSDAACGISVIVRVRERPFVSRFSIEGVDEGLQSRIQELLRQRGMEFRPAAPYDPSHGARAAEMVRSWMAARGYPAAEVHAECTGKASAVVVRLMVRSGPRLGVGGIVFTGNHSIPSGELRSLMRWTRALSWWSGRWRSGGFVPEKLDADLDCIRRFYQARGFARVTVGKPLVTIQPVRRKAYLPLGKFGPRYALHVSIPVVEGEIFFLDSVGFEGDARAAGLEVASIAGSLKPPVRYNADTLETARVKMLRALNRAGYPFARVELEESVDERENVVHALFRINPGNEAFLGRIEFEGNHRVPDKFLRRELRIEEGQMFNSLKVDESVRRLNESGLIEELERDQVSIRENPATGEADLLFQVKEKPPRGIYGTGGTFGADGGYLGIFYTAFNLLGLGERLSLQLDGGVANSNLLLNLAGQHFLGSPFTIGLSVFHRYSGINVASVVPDASDLVHLLTDRRKGARLSGSYSISTRARAGLGFQVESATVDSGNDSPSTPRLTSDICGFFNYDTRAEIVASALGYRFSSAAAVSFHALAGSIESASGSVSLTRHVADPWTSGRNSFVLSLDAAAVRGIRSGGIAPEKRLYPGGEVLRGFRRGELGSWAVGQNGIAGGLRPVGSDTVASVSAAYRVPIAGPLSGAAFFDLGWTRLRPAAVAEPGLRLLDATNGLLRASTGGELRLQLPVVNQPARLVLAWNPLRLNRTLRDGVSIVSLADRRGLLRFALGE